jgi:ribosomal protein S27AE
MLAMRLRLDLQCPRCGGELVLAENRARVDITCRRCGVKVEWSKRQIRARILRYSNGELILDWNWVIDEAYLRMIEVG